VREGEKRMGGGRDEEKEKEGTKILSSHIEGRRKRKERASSSEEYVLIEILYIKILKRERERVKRINRKRET
jgi:hypothetical protein